jgi:MFS family permease
MTLQDAGIRDLEKQEKPASSGDSIDAAGDYHATEVANGSVQTTEKDDGLTKVTSLPQLKVVASNTLSRTFSRITNRDIVDPGPAPGKEKRRQRQRVLTSLIDGGVKAWTQVAMAWLICVTTWGYINSFGVFQTYYTEELGETRSTISWVGSLHLWIVLAMSAFSGRALDAGLFVPALILGSIIQVVGIFMTSLCHNFWQLLLAQGLTTGLGSGIIFCPAMGLVTTYFAKKRGIAVAIITTGNSFGGGVYPVVVRQLLPQIGFPWTVRVLGFINTACLLLTIVFMRPRLPPRKSGPLIEWQAFREVPYVSLIFGLSFVFGALFWSYYYVSNAHVSCADQNLTLQIGSYGREVIGLSYADSANLVILFNVVAVPIRLLSGWLVDKYTGPLNAMAPLIYLNGIIALCWIAVRGTAGLYVFTCVYGMTGGAFQCLFPTTVSSMNKDMSKNGVRLGMAFSIFSLAGLTGPPIGGALVQTNGGGRGGYMNAQIAAGVASMFGACFVVLARVSKDGWKLRKKC